MYAILLPQLDAAHEHLAASAIVGLAASHSGQESDTETGSDACVDTDDERVFEEDVGDFDSAEHLRELDDDQLPDCWEPVYPAGHAGFFCL